MRSSRRAFVTALATGAASLTCAPSKRSEGVTRFVRYRHQRKTSFGILDGETIRQIEGSLFGSRAETGTTIPLGEAKLLYPVPARKVLALAGNYHSHLGDVPAPKNPEPFFKASTALLSPEENIVFPPGAQDVHFEAELVIVIGKRARRVSEEQAADHILGYTCGNDISERNWQGGSLGDQKDVQWWRAKGSDTFAPMGPAIAAGLDYEKSQIQLRLNGEVKQKQMLSDLIFKPPAVVSFISQHVTLLPGDVIYTGTPGETSRIKAGDVVEVEIDGVGVLRNGVDG